MTDANRATAPNPFDPKALSVSLTGGEIFPVKKLLTAVPVRKPTKKEWVRAHPDEDYSITVALLDLNPGDPPYIVMPEVAAAFPGEVRRAEIVLAVNRQGTPFLWPQPAVDPDGRENQWNTSHRMAGAQAKTEWTRMVADRDLGAYQIYTPQIASSDPVWPDYTLARLLEVAFAGRLIDSEDHPVIRQLLGRA